MHFIIFCSKDKTNFDSCLWITHDEALIYTFDAPIYETIVLEKQYIGLNMYSRFSTLNKLSNKSFRRDRFMFSLTVYKYLFLFYIHHLAIDDNGTLNDWSLG